MIYVCLNGTRIRVENFTVSCFLDPNRFRSDLRGRLDLQVPGWNHRRRHRKTVERRYMREISLEILDIGIYNRWFNVAEHSAQTDLLELLLEMNAHWTEGNFSRRVHVESNTVKRPKRFPRNEWQPFPAGCVVRISDSAC